MIGLDSSSWPVAQLSDCAEILSGGTPSKSEPAFWGGSIPWVSAKDMKIFRLHDAEDHVTPEGAINGTRIAPAGSTLVLVRGMTLHDHVPICWLMRDMAFNQDVKAIVPKSHVDPEYLAYWLAASGTRLHGLVDAAGHGTGRIGGPSIRALPVRLPPLEEQRCIAHSLGAVDRKIELNRRMSRTLESIARTIFKSWFVDFDPVGIRDFASEADLPVDWPMARLADLASVSRDSVAPREIRDEVVDHYSIPAFDDGTMPSAQSGSAIKSNKFAVQAGCVLVSRLNPRIPRVWLPRPRGARRGVCSTEYLVLSPKPPFTIEFLYGLLSTDEFGENLECRVTGTSGSHQRVKPLDVMSIPAVSPPREWIHAYSRFAAPMLEQVSLLREEVALLTDLRIALLPRLVNGSLPSSTDLREGRSCLNS